MYTVFVFKLQLLFCDKFELQCAVHHRSPAVVFVFSQNWKNLEQRSHRVQVVIKRFDIFISCYLQVVLFYCFYECHLCH